MSHIILVAFTPQRFSRICLKRGSDSLEEFASAGNHVSKEYVLIITFE